MFIKSETTVENHTDIFLACSSGLLGPKGFGEASRKLKGKQMRTDLLSFSFVKLWVIYITTLL